MNKLIKGLKALFGFPFYIYKINQKLNSLTDELSTLKLSKKAYPDGHFFSPIPNIKELTSNANSIWPSSLPLTLPAIDLNETEQLGLLGNLKSYEFPPYENTPQKNYRYYLTNGNYEFVDAYFLYTMISHISPKKIIEVGSGFSSAVMLDVNEKVFNSAIDLTFIEPYPDERLNSLVRGNDMIALHENCLQDIPLDVFKKLESNDVLFIDSTHVSKIGSDVNYIIHEILPALAKGVYIHFHDIFYPFEYPKNWILQEHRFWNEQYVLRAFLEFNTEFKIVLFGTYLLGMCSKQIEKDFPFLLNKIGGSGGCLWLQKV